MMGLYSSAEHCEICDITRTSGAKLMTLGISQLQQAINDTMKQCSPQYVDILPCTVVYSWLLSRNTKAEIALLRY